MSRKRRSGLKVQTVHSNDRRERRTGSCAHVHARAAGPVDDDRLSRLIHVVLHAEVGRHPVDQHAVVGGHLRELFEGAEEEKRVNPGTPAKPSPLSPARGTHTPIARDEVDHVLLQFEQRHAVSGVAVEGVDHELVQVYAGGVGVLQARL